MSVADRSLYVPTGTCFAVSFTRHNSRRVWRTEVRKANSWLWRQSFIFDSSRVRLLAWSPLPPQQVPGFEVGHAGFLLHPFQFMTLTDSIVKHAIIKSCGRWFLSAQLLCRIWPSFLLSRTPQTVTLILSDINVYIYIYIYSNSN